jgi:osmoprotectant transport system permease protein
MGMTEARILRSVQVPLSMPLILNGIRLSSAAVLATAPLAALVGSGGLGRYIIDGFSIRDFKEVGAGVTLVVVLVVINEIVFAGIARALAKGPRERARMFKRDVLAHS